MPLSTAVLVTFPELSPLRALLLSPKLLGTGMLPAPYALCVWSSLSNGKLGIAVSPLL